ncbi:protein MpNPF17 [Marchantia polymorpha subsp. ruderalis]
MAQVVDSSIPIDLSVSDSLVTRDGTRNYKGEPANKQRTGGYRVLPFIFSAEFAERTAFFGVTVNIITYLFTVKHIHLADAANMVTNFLGASYVFTLVGGFLADTFIGRYWTIVIFILVQTLGIGVLIINASLAQFRCLDPKTCPAAHGTDLLVINLGMYLVALGTGGIKSSVSAFGADQMEKEDPKEAKLLPSYFNWLYFYIMGGVVLAQTVIVYIEDRSWAWGFGSLVIIMAIALISLCAVRKKYRYQISRGSPFTALAKVLVIAIKNRKLPRPSEKSGFYDVTRQGAKLKVAQTNNMRWLDKAAILPEGGNAIELGGWGIATVTEVEDFKMVLRLLPILATTWYFWTVQAQFSTFTVLQSLTSDRRLGPNFVVPSASIGVIQTLAVLVALIFYDKVFMPMARRRTGLISGITSIQRMGWGLVCPILAMTAAALVERKRLQVVHDTNWELKPSVPMNDFSMFWIVPQFFIMGVGEALIFPAQIDFFYNESPENMRSLGTSFCLCTLAIGAFGSSAIVSAVNSATSNPTPWLPNNLNTSRLDNFYWLMAVLSSINLVAFLLVSRYHTYKQTYFADSPLASSSDDEHEQPSKPL